MISCITIVTFGYGLVYKFLKIYLSFLVDLRDTVIISYNVHDRCILINLWCTMQLVVILNTNFEITPFRDFQVAVY